MLHHPTIEKLHALKFTGMATALTEQLNSTEIEALSFEERLGLLIDRECTYRHNRRMSSYSFCEFSGNLVQAPCARFTIVWWSRKISSIRQP